MSEIFEVKHSEKRTLILTTEADLTGATVELRATPVNQHPSVVALTLAVTIVPDETGKVSLVLDGELPPALYKMELHGERGEESFVAPTAGYVYLNVVADLSYPDPEPEEEP